MRNQQSRAMRSVVQGRTTQFALARHLAFRYWLVRLASVGVTLFSALTLPQWAAAQSLSTGLIINNTTVGNVNSSNPSGTVNWRTGDTGNVQIQYTCTSGPCNGVVFTYQAQAPFALWGSNGPPSSATGINTTPVAGASGVVASYTINNVLNRVVVTMNSLPTGTGTVALNNIVSYGGGTPGQTVSHTLSTVTGNAGTPATAIVSVLTPAPTAVLAVPTWNNPPTPTDVALGETVTFSPTLAIGTANQINSRGLIGPATITFTAPAGAVVSGALPNICYSPVGSELQRSTTGRVGWDGTTTPAAIPVASATAPSTTNNTLTWTIPAGNVLRFCGSTFSPSSVLGYYNTGNPNEGSALLIPVQFPGANFSNGQAIATTICVNGFYPGASAGSPDVASTCATRAGVVRSPYLTTRVTKRRQNTGYPAIGDLDQVRLVLENFPPTTPPSTDAPVTLTSWTLRDQVPANARMTQAYAWSYTPSAPALTVQWRYRLASNPSVWVNAPSGSTLNFCTMAATINTVCAVTPTDWVLEWEWRWDSTLPGNPTVPPNQQVLIDMQYQLVSPGSGGTVLATGGTVANTATLDATSNAGVMTQGVGQEIYTVPAALGGRWMTHPNALIDAQVPIRSNAAGIGSNASCAGHRVTNTATPNSTGTMADPVLVVSMPGDYTNYSYSLNASQAARLSCQLNTGPFPFFDTTSLPLPTVTMMPNYQGSGRVAAIARWSGVSVPRGCRIGDFDTTGAAPLLTLTGEMTAATLAGTNANACLVTIFSDNPVTVGGHNASSGPWENVSPAGATFPQTVGLIDINDVNQNGNTAETLRWVNASLTVPSIPSVQGSKRYLRAGNPVTTVERGGVIDTELRLRNTGNDTMTGFTIVDVLPVSGDVDFTGTTRGSTTAARLTGAISGLPAGVVATYSTVTNPCRSSSSGSNPDGAASNLPVGCNVPNWQTAAAIGAAWSSVSAVRFVGTGQNLLPYATSNIELAFTFPLTIDSAAITGQLVNNQAVVDVTLAVGANVLLPFGTSIASATVMPAQLAGRVYNDLNSNGAQEGGEAGLQDFVVSITCTAGPSCTPGDVYSTLSNASGEYNFIAGSTDIFANATATGSTIPSFAGLVSGTWTMSIAPPAGLFYTNVSRTVGTINGVPSGSGTGRSISDIVMTAAGIGAAYNFGEVLTPGQITVTKMIAVGSPVGTPTGPFNVFATCDQPTSGTRYPSLGSVVITTAVPGVIGGIPAGASCSITEDSSVGNIPLPPAGYTWSSPTYTQPIGSVPAGGNLEATVQNSLSALVGTIRVSKALTLPPGVVGPFNFGFVATCDLPIAGSTYSATLTDYPMNTTADITNVPVGASCNLTETLPGAPAGYSWNVPAVGAFNPVGTMPAGGVQTVTVANTLMVNDTVVTVTKTVSGGPLSGAPGVYGISIVCAAPNAGPFTGEVTLTGAVTSGTTTISVPAAATACTVIETARASAPSGYSWNGTLPVAGTALSAQPSPGGTATSTVRNVVTPLDPPFVLKRGRVVDDTTIEWTITVINNPAANAGQAPVPVEITDALPVGVTLVAGSVSCIPSSVGAVGNSTTVATCGVDAGNSTLRVTGSIAYSNTASASAESSPERITVVFQGTVARGAPIVNVACAVNAVAPNARACSATVNNTPVPPVPINAGWTLLLLVILLLSIARRRRAEPRL